VSSRYGKWVRPAARYSILEKRDSLSVARDLLLQRKDTRPVASLFTRMRRAARLDAALYEEVEADHSALWQATSVVVLSSLAAGIGSRGIGGLGAC